MEGWLELMKLQSKLNEVIKQKGYQKQFVAKKVGVSKTQFANWCTNKAVPSVLNAMVLAKMLDCKVEDLFEIVEE